MKNHDAKILSFASQFSLITHQHLCELTGMHPNSLWRSLPRLVKNGELYCKELGMYRPNVYATYDITKRKRSNFSHDLTISDVHLALSKMRHWQLFEWRQPRQKVKGGLNEDAMFTLRLVLAGNPKTISYYLEVDTGSEPDWQIEERISRYLVHGVKGHILFVVNAQHEDAPARSQEECDKRVSLLVRKAERFLAKDAPDTWKKFLFTTRGEMIQNASGAICRVAHDSNKYPIAPDLFK